MKKTILITVHKGIYGKEIDRMYHIVNIKDKGDKRK